jgi:tRNA(Ile)-lysidine synthase
VAHGLRSPEVDGSEGRAVTALAAHLRVGSTVVPIDVLRTGGGPESDAREARYAALEAEASRLGAVAVLVGHHADDQAETVLLRLARGTGIDGLAAMAPVAGRLIRPLLDVRRDDLHRAGQALLGEVFATVTHDPMNDQDSVRRVRIRRALMPSLREIGPDPVGALTRVAALAREESSALAAVTAQLLVDLPVTRIGPVVAIPSAGLRALPDGLARRVIRHALVAAAPQPEGDSADRPRRTGVAPTAATIERVLRAPDGWRATVPGPLDVSIEHGWHVVAPAAMAADGPVRLLPSGGRPDDVVHAASGIRITAATHRSGVVGGDGAVIELVADSAGAVVPGLDPDRFAVRIRLPGPLAVRTRREGDRIRTVRGTRSLADVMGEARIPRAVRALLPVVVCSEDVVRWVPGLVVDARLMGSDSDTAREPA